MALRMYRLRDDEWQRLAATRRKQDLAATPPRASIGAIETELSSLDSPPPGASGSTDSE
jgi:hypothetical protein